MSSTCTSPTAEAFFQEAISNSHLNQPAGEAWAWHANFNLGYFVQAYRAWRDREWLEQGVKYYDFLLQKLQRGPDGYYGWIGPYIYDQSQWADVHVADAILWNGMLQFAELVLGSTELSQLYGEKAHHYVSMAEKHLLEKWDARGTWYKHGPFGGYHTWNQYFNPGDLSRWHQRDEIKNSNLSLPFNKNNVMGLAALRLFRITGKEAYRKKAMVIFATLKSRFQLHDDYYVWNYWEPLVPWDINTTTNTTRHWVNVHPFRNYQAGEVAHIVEAFHSGIVFSVEDIQRLVRTNLKVMWNQDKESPSFTNSNARLMRERLPENHTAGTLWLSLAYFDPTIRKLARFGREPRDLISQAFFEEVMAKEPPSYRRRLSTGAAEEYLFPFSDTRYLHMAFALPASFKAGEEIIVAVKSLYDGYLDVDVLAAEQQVVSRLYSDAIVGNPSGHGGLKAIRWNGKDGSGVPLPAGEYFIRWTLQGEGQRIFPIEIKHSH